MPSRGNHLAVIPARVSASWWNKRELMRNEILARGIPERYPLRIPWETPCVILSESLP